MRNKVSHVVIYNVIYQVNPGGPWFDGLRIGDPRKQNKYVFLDLNFKPINNINKWKSREDFIAKGMFEHYEDESITK